MRRENYILLKSTTFLISTFADYMKYLGGWESSLIRFVSNDK